MGSKVAQKKRRLPPKTFGDVVEIRGARQNNLKGVDVDLPLGKLTVVTGPPGAGNGTQAYRLASHYDLPLIATGDIFRRNVVEGTPLGLEAQRYMDAGECETTDKVMQSVAGRPWDLWKAKALGKSQPG